MLQNIYSTTNVLQCVPFLWFAHVLVFSGVTCNLLTCIYDYNNFQKYITHDFHDRVIPVSNAVLPAGPDYFSPAVLDRSLYRDFCG